MLLRRDPARSASPAQATEDERLARLTGWARSHAYPVLLELVVPPEPPDVEEPGWHERFDRDVRPSLMVEVMAHLQDIGVEPDVWKSKGSIAPPIARPWPGSRSETGASMCAASLSRRWREYLAGRGSALGPPARSRPTPGFAIGRSLWWDPLREDDRPPDQRRASGRT